MRNILKLSIFIFTLLFVVTAKADLFSGQGPAGCTDRACWQEAVDKAVGACNDSGATSCSVPADAADNCVFSEGYTCYSLSAGTFAGKGPVGCTDRACWQEAVQKAVDACNASGATSCSVAADASDNCYFANGYTCYSTGTVESGQDDAVEEKVSACYWMSNQPGNPWLPAPQGNLSKEECSSLDSCHGGQGMSGGGCYKWATGPDADHQAW